MLESNEALWRSHSVSDYDFTIRMVCMCPPPAGISIRVAVRGGRAVDAYDSQNPDAEGIIDMGDIPNTIPAMFATVRSSIDTDPDTIAIDYDVEYGFPFSMQIDHRRDYDDDDVAYAISDFEPVGNISY